MGVVAWVCAELVPERLALSAEDNVHRGLAAALAAAAAILIARGPSASHSGAARPSGDATELAPELTRRELDAEIARLSRWFERRAGEPRTPDEVNLRLLSLGRAALPSSSAGSGSALVLGNLQALATTTAAAAPARAPTIDHAPPDPGPRSAIGDADPAATLAILLEAGTPLTEDLPLASGSIAVGRLLELALAGVAPPAEGPDPWALDLLSFAVLGGKLERREQLGRLAQLGLSRLEWQRREAQAVAPRQADVGTRQNPRQLQLAASLFRAVAVLDERELDEPALRLLNVLLQRQSAVHEGYRVLLASASDAAARARLHVEALEHLGRLQQALYGAHVAFRSSERPAPRTADGMRRAARDLLGHLDALRSASLLDPGAGAAPSPELLRAVAHALRGLRASRVAHPAAT